VPLSRPVIAALVQRNELKRAFLDSGDREIAAPLDRKLLPPKKWGTGPLHLALVRNRQVAELIENFSGSVRTEYASESEEGPAGEDRSIIVNC
jgi:hypothetical protein